MYSNHDSTLNFSANDLIKSGPTNKLQKNTSEIYRAIKSKIIEAHNAGLAEICTELPDTFDVGSMKIKDIQLVIYSDLIELLENDGFSVAIEWYNNNNSSKQSDNSILYIKWSSALSSEEKKRRAAIIATHFKQKNL